MFSLTMHYTHFVYRYMVSDMVKDNEVAARDYLCATSYRQDSTYDLCYTSRGVLAGMRNSLLGTQ